MSEYTVDVSRVLIVPGYTDTEILQMQDDSSSVTVDPPQAFYFDCLNVDYVPHIKDYEEFPSADGLILIEKNCDLFAELTLQVLVYQHLTNMTGEADLGEGDKRTVRLNVPGQYNKEQDLGNGKFSLPTVPTPDQYTDEYIELRKSFFDNLIGRPLTIVSPLFPSIPVCYMTDCNYSVSEATEELIYECVFREVANTTF